MGLKMVAFFLLLTPVSLWAQKVDSFYVKKPAPALSGFYCSDYMTDGRVCLFFDSAGMVHEFVTNKAIADAHVDFEKGAYTIFSTPFSVRGDTVRFVSAYPIQKTGEKLDQIISGEGVINSDKIFLNQVLQVNKLAPVKKLIILKKVP